MATRKKAPPKKPTSTARGMAYLDRLDVGKGKRLLVDINNQARQALETLLANGYGKTQREVVENALLAAVVTEPVH